ncbi:MAG: OPT/YSL family transporter [Candidatus Thermoplasmatota archaeon]|nr:OPT/YSL family transporter [Candidatus Thermoplasmatota archaeon]
MPIPKRTYRNPPSAEGLEKIEKGTLEYLDIEVWPNLNSGVMEEYFEEKNQVESFNIAQFSWSKVLIGILLGTLFAVITEYVGLKVGLAISGGWYIMYLLGAGARWKPAEINIAAGACTGATYVGTGFIFTFPALYLLTDANIGPTGSPVYAIAGGDTIIKMSTLDANPSIMIVALITSIVTGMLGTLYFIILRKIWLVDDPLHVPGYEPNLQLMEIANDLAVTGNTTQAKKSLSQVFKWTGISMLFSALRDFPVGKMDESYAYYWDYATENNPEPAASPLDMMFAGSPFYDKGNIIEPYYTTDAMGNLGYSARYTHLGFGLIPIQIGIGWFMKLRVAFLVNMGTFVSWFIVVPLAVWIGTPIFDAASGVYLNPNDPDIWVPSYLVFAKVARPIAVGAILGGGLFSLFKMLPTFKTAFGDVTRSFKGEGGGGYIEGRGWYEWPSSHILFMMIFTFFVCTVLFTWGIPGTPLYVAAIFSVVLVVTTFALGAIAVKVMGETGTQPVSGTSFIVLIMMVALFMLFNLPTETTAILAIIGTTTFAGAISMAGDIIWDFKSGLYVGNRPFHLMKGELWGIIPGAVAALLGAVMFSRLLVTGQLALEAPQANAFATIVQTFLGGSNLAMIGSFLIIGFILGIVAEITTGMGTAFGLGMYFPLWLMLPMIFGGALRDWWEKTRLEPRAKREGWTEKKKTLKTLDTYMIATGLIIGEALMGTIVALVFMFA